jgi:hypothetical protein
MLRPRAASETKDAGLFRDAFVRTCSHLPMGVAILTGIDAALRLG